MPGASCGVQVYDQINIIGYGAAGGPAFGGKGDDHALQFRRGAIGQIGDASDQHGEEDRLQEKTSDLSAGSSCEELAQVEQTAIFGIQNYVKIGRKEIAVKEMPAP